MAQRQSAPDDMRGRSLQNAFLFGLLLLTTLAFLGLIQDLLHPIFWAAVLATLFYPTYQWLHDALKGRSALAAVGTIGVIILSVIVPLLLMSLAVASEASGLYQRLTSNESDLMASLQSIEQMLPVASDLLDRFGLSLEELRQQFSDAAVGISQYLASRVVALGQNALRVVGLFFLMLYLLFFFLCDGRQLLDTISGLIPLGDVRERRLFAKFAEVSRATIKGTIVIGLVQGVLGGLIFWALGIGGAALWGVVMTVLSFLPAVGAALVWAPASVILMATGQFVKGLLLLILGILIIGLADNVLRPILVGRETQLPDYLVLLTTLGGLTLFGLSGVVIGPIIGALFLTTWQMFGQEYAGAVRDIGAAQNRHSSVATSAPQKSDPQEQKPPS